MDAAALPIAPIPLERRLLICAELWVAANEASRATLAALGRAVINDSSFFNRLESPRGTTTATLNKFARYLNDGTVWPDGDVPEAVRVFAHVVGVSAEAADASTGLIGEMSSDQSEAAE